MIRVFTTLMILFGAVSAFASSDAHYPKDVKWSFEGPFGKFDRQAAQRGFQVYREVCSSCHSLKRIAYRNLEEIGFSRDEIKEIAASYNVIDGPDTEGEMFERPATPADRFVSPYPNDNAAKVANGGALPPDLSLIIKARLNGPDYVYSLLTGYSENPPAHVELGDGQYYNQYFAGGKIGMPPPLGDDMVEYSDGTEATLSQQSEDVVHFLQWAAEPEMEARKKTGVRVLAFLALLTVLFILAKKAVWRDVK